MALLPLGPLLATLSTPLVRVAAAVFGRRHVPVWSAVSSGSMIMAAADLPATPPIGLSFIWTRY